MSDQLKGAFGAGKPEQQQDNDTAKMVVAAVIGAGQQALVNEFKFTEQEAGAWAKFTVALTQSAWDILRPELPPTNDNNYFKMVARMVLNSGVQVLQMRFGFDDRMAPTWTVRTTTLVSKSASFAEKEARKKRPRKPKVNRDERD